jgi:hypothetical protein
MTKLYIAIPTHSNMITVDTALSLLALERHLPAHGIETQTAFHASSMISHLRNTIIAHFLADDATHVLMLDSDQGVPPDLVGRMIAFNKPLVGVIYPRRNYNFNQVRFPYTSQTPERFFAQALRFVGDLMPDEQGEIEIINGFARAKNIGTGAMLIRRDVIEKLITHYPDLFGAGFPDEAEYEILARHNWGFFNPYTKQFETENSGEDVAFCNRWTQIGGEIWADVATNTTHIGRHGITGNFLSHLQSFE